MINLVLVKYYIRMVYFIINADDYWISDRFDEAIIDLIEKEYLYSISIIVRNISQKSINRILPYFPKISPGLHFEYKQKEPEDDEYANIRKELEIQYQKFFDIFGIYPTHLDKHNREKSENEIKVICDFAIENKIPIRLYTRGKKFEIFEKNYKDKIRLTDFLYNIWAKNYWLKRIKSDIKDKTNSNQIYEVICHPGFFDPEYDSELNETQMNKKRAEDYKKIVQLWALLKKEKLKIVSFEIMNKKRR